MRLSLFKAFVSTAICVLLVACGAGTQSEYDSYPGSAPGDKRVGTTGRSQTIADQKKEGTLFGPDGFNFLGGEEDKNQSGGTGIGVNRSESVV